MIQLVPYPYTNNRAVQKQDQLQIQLIPFAKPSVVANQHSPALKHKCPGSLNILQCHSAHEDTDYT